MPEERKRGISEEVCKMGGKDSDAATVRCVCICKQEVNKRGNPGGLKEGCWNDCSFLSPPGCLSSTDERTATFRKPLLAALSFFAPWVGGKLCDTSLWTPDIYVARAHSRTQSLLLWGATPFGTQRGQRAMKKKKVNTFGKFKHWQVG